jgi:hypothetical protein
MTTDDMLAIARAATPMDSHTEIIRYEHGGGRVARFESERRLIADFYNEADRECWIAARDKFERLLEFVQAWDARQQFEASAEDMDVFDAIEEADRLVTAIFAKRRALDEA